MAIKIVTDLAHGRKCGAVLIRHPTGLSRHGYDKAADAGNHNSDGKKICLASHSFPPSLGCDIASRPNVPIVARRRQANPLPLTSLEAAPYADRNLSINWVKIGGTMRKNRVLPSALCAVAAILASQIAVSPATASELDIFDPQALVQSLAPEVLDSNTQDYSHVDVVSGAPDAKSRSLVSSSSVVVDDIEVSQEGQSGVAMGTTISVDYATGTSAESGDFTVLDTSYENVAAYVQPNNTGVRLLTAIADSSAPTSYSYTFDVPEGSFLTDNHHGYYLRGPDGGTLGALDYAWAVDASGNSVPTSYEWSGTTLTQIVDLTAPGLTFPVLADPSWTYTHTYTLEHTTVPEVRALLMNCFGCYFPIEGAPQAFPASDQFLPLVVRPFPDSAIVWNTNCYMGGRYYENYGGGEAYFGYDFRAAPGHVDGLGSAIYFDFNPMWQQATPNTKFGQLVVTGWVVNPTPMGFSPAFITNMTWWNWLKLAQNVNV